MSPTEAPSVIVAEESEISAVWPWQAEPFRLWSLLDMLRFHAASFAASMTQLGRAAEVVDIGVQFDLQHGDRDRTLIKASLDEAAPSLEELPLSAVIQQQFRRLRRAADNAEPKELVILLRELYNNLLVELSSAWFLMIPAEKRERFEQRGPAFGESVAERFPDGAADIASASRCLALDEWTACVFHLMRCLEHGLRDLASKVGLPSDVMAHENWKNAIDQIEKKIRELEAAPKSATKVETLRIYSEAASQFRWFKDAWRNHVSHSRANYDARDAESVWHHVKQFMQHLAANA
jgi:hypothetical protein